MYLARFWVIGIGTTMVRWTLATTLPSETLGADDVAESTCGLSVLPPTLARRIAGRLHELDPVSLAASPHR